jgi:hypothetical protein
LPLMFLAPDAGFGGGKRARSVTLAGEMIAVRQL